ncbi:hypothetical protein PP1Y_Lpl2102 (plasmid) [Novosphingobium sp. PP1Y]|nr:hypothetical protein PP1Y_Lpl2102 [Novosphingobium sp. PP1Y]
MNLPIDYDGGGEGGEIGEEELGDGKSPGADVLPGWARAHPGKTSHLQQEGDRSWSCLIIIASVRRS